jgi:phosphohistidine swiveling domain-containing protein
LVEIGVLTQEDFDNFSSSVSTVNKKMVLDRHQLKKPEFLSKYGHLRPGTYDILSSRYDEEPDLYFDWKQNKDQYVSEHDFSLDSDKIKEIDRLLVENGLNFDCKGMFAFIKSAIELREYSKFEFTKNISEALVCISDFGSTLGFCKDDLSFANISVFKELKISAIDQVANLNTSVEKGKEQFTITKRLSMPPIIVKPEDVWSFEWPDSEPNFITQKKVIASTVLADRRHELDGAVVCIPSADPGFDWLFSYEIAGLVTAWGGANSHMAIRASELSLPAVIGVGEKKYQKVAAAKMVEIDCVLRKLEVYQQC